MQNLVQKYLKEFQEDKQRRHRLASVFLVLALAVALGVTWSLKMDGIAVTNTAYCGEEEHTHSDDCYTSELVCGLEEGEGHTHTDSCYETESVLSCEKEEHTHSDGCYTTEKVLVCGEEEGDDHAHDDSCYEERKTLTCGKEEHTHSDGCYTTEKTLVCGKEESEGHTHSASCYEETLTCGKEEHTHTATCYSDESADVETASDWEKTLPEISDSMNEDIARVAESQLGYTESTKNFVLADDGETRKGYTRYGAWYGNEYGDWDAMFASFCLYYAGCTKDIFPYASGSYSWVTELKEAGLYQSAADAEPAVGDILFFDEDGDGKADTCGVVTKVTESKITVIQGDDNDKVAKEAYSVDDSTILGCGVVPRDEEDPADETDPADASAEGSAIGTDPADAGLMLADTSGSGSDSGTTTANDLSKYLTGVSGSGTEYDATTGNYTTSLTLNFTFVTEEVKENGSPYTYTMTLPDGVIVPSKLIGNSYNLTDNTSGAQGGTYTFTKNSDGTYSVTVTLNNDYVARAGNEMTGHITLNAQLKSSAQENDGSIKVEFSDDDVLVIPPGNIKYPDDKTVNYDISVTKSAKNSLNGETGTLTYTVEVWTTKGTPDPITLTDVLDLSGLTGAEVTVGNVSISSVQNLTKTWTDQWNSSTSEGSYLTAGTTATGGYTSSYDSSTGTLTMTLPGLSKPTTNSSSQTETHGYRITYTVPLTDVPDELVTTVSNKVNVNAEDEKTGEEVKDDAEAKITFNKTYGQAGGDYKTGYYSNTDGGIKWTISLNNSNMNIAGMTLTDTYLVSDSKITESEITIEPKEGYELVKDADGYVTGIKFTETTDGSGSNTNSYTITYLQKVTQTWPDITEDNKAYLDEGDDGDGDGNGPYLVGEATVTVGGGKLEKTVSSTTTGNDSDLVTWRVNITLPEAGLAAGTEIIDTFPMGMTLSAEEIQKAATGFRHMNGYKNTWDENKNVTWTGLSYGSDESGDYNVYFYWEDSTGSEWASLSDVESSIGNTTSSIYGKAFSKFKIVLNKDVYPDDQGSVLRLEYETTVNHPDPGYSTFKNTVNIIDKNATYEYTAYTAAVTKTDEDGNTGKSKTSSSGALMWKVKVNTSKDATTVTLIDTLPTGVTLDRIDLSELGGGTLTVEEGKEDEAFTINNGAYTGTYTYKKDGACTITIKAGTGSLSQKTFSLTYNCTAESAVDDDGNTVNELKVGDTYTYTNTVTMKEGDAEIGSSEQTQEWTKTVKTVDDDTITKSSAWVNANQWIVYTIVINPDGDDLVAGSDTIKLTDVFKYKPQYYKAYFELMQAQVELYKAVNNGDGTYSQGDEVTDWSWTYSEYDNDTSVNMWGYSTRTIEAVVPDSTPLILTYKYKLMSYELPKNADGSQWNPPTLQNLNIENTVTLYGDSQKSDTNDIDNETKLSDTSGAIETGKSYTFYKVEENNFGVQLAGAVFSVYKYLGEGVDGADEDGYATTATTTYTTDGYGSFAITLDDVDGEGKAIYTTNTLYKIVETTAPTGYILPDDPTEYYFYWSDSEDTEHTLPTLPSSAVDLSENSHTVDVENEKNATSIKVDKKWFDVKGNDVTDDQTGSINFDLYQIASTTKPDDSGDSGDSGGGSSSSATTLTDTLTRWSSTISTNTSSTDSSGETLKAGATVTVSVYDMYNSGNTPTVTFNGSSVTLTKTEGSWTPSWGGTQADATYTATLTLASGSNTLITDIALSDGSYTYSITITNPADSGDSGDSGDTSGDTGEEETTPTVSKFGSYTISANDGWTWSSSSLPAQGTVTNDDGTTTTVYYTYKVEETGRNPTSITNNAGISSGTITINNTVTDEDSYTLPESGGMGTTPLTIGGLLTCAGALLLLHKPLRRGKEER